VTWDEDLQNFKYMDRGKKNCGEEGFKRERK